MAYINTETNQIGNLRELLPNISNAYLLSEEDLLVYNIIKYVAPPPPEPTLDELKESKNSEIKGAYNSILLEGYNCSLGFTVDVRPSDIANWTSNNVMLAVTGTTQTQIRDFYNVSHIITKQEYDTIAMELGAYYATQFKNKWFLQDLIKEATTKEEVEAIYWRTPIYDIDEMTIIGYNYNPLLD